MIITLCGSARWEKIWHEVNKQLGLQGHICFSLMTFPSIEGDKSWYTPEQKEMLDLAHLLKIEMSDAVVMLNVNGYLGESSTRELKWARMRKKEIFWLDYIDPRVKDIEENHLYDLLPSKSIDPIEELLNSISKE